MAQNMKKKAVLFDLGGVLFEPPQNALRKYGEQLGLPGSFLEKAMIQGRPDNAFCRMERGESTARQFAEEFTKDCQTLSKEEGQVLPKDFNASSMFDTFMNIKMVPDMLNAVSVLKQNGVKTAAVTNNYIDDREQNSLGAGVMTTLSSFYFDHFVESCRFGKRKPDQSIFNEALKKLGVKAEEAVFLDDLGPNVKAAREMGISTVLVKDTSAALKELQEVTGIDVFQEAKPVSVHHERVPHSYATTRSGVKFHYVDIGSGPPVIFCHGFPESWYEWKSQIPAVAAAGFRVIAMDMKGYGESSNPPEIEEYTLERMCKDMAEFMDTLCIPQATFIGHDWGGFFVWNYATHYPDRVSAVGGICTPFFPANDTMNPWENINKNPGLYDYQLYFNEVGPPEAEIEANVEKFVKAFMRRPLELKEIGFSVAGVRAKGGIMAGIPDDINSTLLTEDDVQYYVKQFKTCGLRSMLNWYRTMEVNWKFNHRAIGRKLYMPALMVTCAWDEVLPPSVSKFMDPFVVNLTRAHIEDSGHWASLEQPKKLNKILVDWLNKVHKDSNRPIFPSSL
ncbi:soluble epoxide hydrolase-like protein 1 [Strongylocentrotus purpuratus]|uniref:Soluble epoxide hydrolase-like protein 1 n=1 Tax=Strongylocentrotus purpuratus TaxID=7668 RepID=B2MWN2_STRPU|nr:epoxide hydrolase 2 [Strongylocentrotus purpuratus]ACC95977.1 soluble epoxide hydrolase-like protein 1 [Strongylocentrotus purpuratus]|eukprot:NP_001121538.1 soluble epoxide hydrolase-like protein 1 [Strongylocentrotus purpuratus]